MDTLSILLFFVIAFLGAVVGALIQRAISRRPPPRGSQPQAAPAGKVLASTGDVEIMQAWRTVSGNIWLEMDGVRLEGTEPLQPDQRRRLLSMLLDLRPWLDNTPLPAAVASGTQTRPEDPIPPVKKGKNNPQENKPVIVLKSIVEQINEVLQVKLQNSPLNNRYISLSEGPGGVVIVNEGLKKYEGIDAMPDPEVRALIRQAVSEWEKKV